MKNLFLITFIILCVTNLANSQTVTYPVEFSGYKIRDITASKFDNGILLTGYKTNEIDISSLGYGIVKKLDVNANTLWEKFIGTVPPPGLTNTFQISQTSNGGYILVVYIWTYFTMQIYLC